MADFLNGIFISEILADNAGNNAVDVDGDGNVNKADEFVEIVNASGAPISLNGYQLWSQKNGLLYSFPTTAVLGSGSAATVLGNYTGTPPPGFYSAGLPENGDFLPDGEGQRFDSIFLVDTNTGDYVVVSYGQPLRAPTLPPGFTGTNRIGAGESITSNAPNGTAFARDASGDFQETSPTPGTPNLSCFAQDTMILTKTGERPVSELRPGDKIPTYDLGTQPLLGICSVHLKASELLRAPAHRPLTVDGALFDTPGSIRLSPSHCLLFTSAMADALYASSQVLLRARHLETAGLARSEIPRDGVTYYHLLFAEHALVLANGFWAESYLNLHGKVTDAHVPKESWAFAEGVTLASLPNDQSARRILRKYETLVLMNSLGARKTARQPEAAPTTNVLAYPKLRHLG